MCKEPQGKGEVWKGCPPVGTQGRLGSHSPDGQTCGQSWPSNVCVCHSGNAFLSCCRHLPNFHVLFFLSSCHSGLFTTVLTAYSSLKWQPYDLHQHAFPVIATSSGNLPGIPVQISYVKGVGDNCAVEVGYAGCCPLRKVVGQDHTLSFT